MIKRPRRLRTSPILRNMVKETKISADSFILPLFLTDGTNIKNPIPTLENHHQYSVDRICADVEVLLKKGVTKFLLFGIPEKKDETGSESFSENGIVNRSLKELKKQFGKHIYLISDVCLCEYTNHGHCGLLTCEGEHPVVDNDQTLEILGKVALSNAQSGADMIAPSDMMDGRIRKIRSILDENQLENTPIMSYSAKYASSFYGPFREAAQSAPSFGDRKTYQMDFRNSREAIREVHLDEAEGADIVMIKPALSYLDIISKVRAETTLPISAYSVSGEYAMIKAVHKTGFMDEHQLMIETATSIFRAGADILISYYTPELVEATKKGEL